MQLPPQAVFVKQLQAELLRFGRMVVCCVDISTLMICCNRLWLEAPGDVHQRMVMFISWSVL